MTENKHRKVAKAHSFRSQLIRLGACHEALEWVGHKSLHTAWRTCKRGDWMLWLAGRVGIDRPALVLAACQCARLALVHVKPGEERPRVAIETAEAWCRGTAGVTLDDVRAAADAAYAARDAANAANVANAARGAAPAANAAANAANAAYATTNAAAAVAAANVAYSAAAANAAAYAAAYAAYAADADASAYNAAYAAYAAASAAAYAAYAADADAAYAARDAAADADAAYAYNAAVRAAMLRACADVMRAHISASIIEAAIEAIDD